MQNFKILSHHRSGVIGEKHGKPQSQQAASDSSPRPFSHVKPAESYEVRLPPPSVTSAPSVSLNVVVIRPVDNQFLHLDKAPTLKLELST
jgi:hypothetical protein